MSPGNWSAEEKLHIGHRRRTLFVSSGNLPLGNLKFALMVFDDELPHSLDLRLLLTCSPCHSFLSHVVLPVTVYQVREPNEILVTKVEDSHGFEDRKAKRFVLGAVSDSWQVSELGSGPRLACLHQHVIAKVIIAQSFSERLYNLGQRSNPLLSERAGEPMTAH